jgi:hypothetical protein
MSDRHLLHEFMTGKSHADSARRERQIQVFIQIGIGAVVLLAIGQFLNAVAFALRNAGLPSIVIVLRDGRRRLARIFLGQGQQFATAIGLVDAEIGQHHFQCLLIRRPAKSPHTNPLIAV